MRALTKAVLLALVLVTGWSFGQQPAPDKAKAEKEGQGNRSLEELLATALQQSPDIQIAEAKMREAQAELRRTRLALLQKVIAAHAAVESSRATVAQAEAALVRINQLLRNRAVSSEEVHKAEYELAITKAQHAQAEANLNALTGTLPGALAGLVRGPGDGGAAGVPGPGGMAMGGAGMPGMPGGMMVGVAGGALGVAGGMGGGIGIADESQGRMPRGPMAEKIRKALDTPVTLTTGADGVKLAGVADALRTTLPDVPFLVNVGDKKNEVVSLTLTGKVPLGAAFQALQDVVPGLHCFVREYGILITLDDAAPADGMPVIEFWHRKPEASQTNAGAKE